MTNIEIPEKQNVRIEKDFLGTKEVQNDQKLLSRETTPLQPMVSQTTCPT